MSRYIQLLGSDTPNGYGGCCYYGPLDHPALRESTFTCSTGSSSSTGVVPPQASRHIGAVDAEYMLQSGAEVSISAPTLELSVRARAHDTLHQPSPTKEAAESAVSPLRNYSSYLAAKRPTWPRAGLLHPSTLLHPRSPSPSVSPSAVAAASAPHVTGDAGLSGGEGYIFFNCPEGTQRFSSEANIKLKKVRGFFFTRWSSTGASASPSTSATIAGSAEDEQHRSASADPVADSAPATMLEGPVGAASAVMGLPGMLFTINDAGVRHATFFGPSVALDGPQQLACIDALTPASVRNGDGGSKPHHTSAHTHAPVCPFSCACDSVALSSTGRSTVAAAGAQQSPPLPSTGLRGFLTALRLHYFQYRPMIFRQLHGVVRRATDEAVGCSHGDTLAGMTATAGNNQLYFVETVGEPTMLHGSREGGPLADASPFVHATLPLSSQSLLVAFRVSGGHRNGKKASATAAAAASDVMLSLSQPASPPTMTEGEQRRHLHSSVLTEGRNERTVAGASASTVSFTAPTSHDVVFGYAIIVAPGSSFDAAKACALGVRSGPKYGQLKLGMCVEADMVVDAVDRSVGPMPPSQNAIASCGQVSGQSPTPTQRWVYPHQVMRPTAATKHAYISLVLDGDRPEDVREALTRLLGSSFREGVGLPEKGSAAACEEAAENDDACRNTAAGEHGGGVLQRLLREHFPHLAYYYEEEEEVGEGVTAAPPHSQKPRWSRRPRQLAVRHVVHVQPTSYFAEFEHRCRPSALPCSSRHEAGAPSVYAAYNAYIFADVAGQHDPLHQHRHICRSEGHREEEAVAEKAERGSDAVVPTNALLSSRQKSSRSLPAVQLSLTPSLSFTLHDMAEDADDDAGMGEDGECESSSKPTGEAHRRHSPQLLHGCPPAARLPRRTTWHLFTSYVQRHFTAFPTALVHRYHLHHLAPSLFPIVGATVLAKRTGGADHVSENGTARSGVAGESTSSAEASDSGGAVRTQRAKTSASDLSSTSADDSVVYWPYSLKLRCVPEAAVQLFCRNQGAEKKKTVQVQQRTELAGSLRLVPSAVNASSGHATAGVTSSSRPLLTPRKRERQTSSSPDTPSATACRARASASASTATAAKPRELTPPLPPPAAARTRPPSAPPRHVAVVDGVASLLPYPTPASALALLSATFLRSLKTNSAAATRTGSASVAALTSTERHMNRDDSFEALQQAVDMASTGTSGIGGGALGFLGTGSAVPSKYRNVSGTFLELHLPSYCFPGRGCPAKRLLHEDDRVNASETASVVAEDTPSATRARPPAGEAACPWGGDDVLLDVHSTNSSARSHAPAAARIDGSQPAVPPRLPSTPMSLGFQQLRRGVVILDFGEGSTGQLASLCGHLRGGGACSHRSPCCALSTSPLHCALGGHQESGRDRCKGAGDHGEDAGSNALSPHTASAAGFTEMEDDADKRLGEFVLDIILVFISHAHADHHLGLMSLLTLRHQYLQRGQSALPSVPKLLVVCPTEVYAFMMDTWGGTAPYRTWLHEECVFDLMPPPVSALHSKGVLSGVLAREGGGAAPHGRQQKPHAVAPVADNSTRDSADGTEPERDSVDGGDVDPGRAASFTHRCPHRHRPTLHSSDYQPEQQHVVPMRLLQAHLAAWNRAIAVGIRDHQRQPLSDLPLLSSAEPLAATSMTAARRVDCDGDAAAATAAAAALGRDNVWWDAEVITVDHPANAHALLLRFPFCSPVTEAKRQRGVCSEASDGGATCAANSDAAEAATGRQRSAELFSCIPDSSRVLLFSGDTRPSSFLVEQSWAFAASTRNSLPRCSDSFELTDGGGLVTGKADSGRAFEEEEGVALEAKLHGSGTVGRLQRAALVRLPTSLPPSSSAPPSSPSSPVFILVHEATFGPGFEDEAVRKKHSTLPEALRIGAAVQAEYIVLNHFSQRYPKLPGLSKELLGGRSTSLVCQRRTRASAAVPATSAVTGAGAEHPANLVDDGVGGDNAPRSSDSGEQQRSTGKASSTAPREDGGHTKGDRGAEQTEDSGQPLPPPPADAADAAVSLYANMSFAFDLMSVSFSDMQRGLVSRLTPTLVRLLEEYDSWGIGTTQRIRSGGEGSGGGRPPK
ncbi:conserved hypothetical protein [Leishmania braziliensis MHOM/BR/75/M2904]|uniref:ribonuclease Z n=2 Tax=Leishmania braziliensis TaxID=5660 RepID=A4H5D6_LEIBR|nr:conserved hypothetical protein [Leishmania braziliensis MHOM/BR/75/M2904]CAJ2467114.1 unnamed protein product [Leishmania braziliensis]CAM37161.2 conserved hypothetical protein [Leishmania braziliensis MHOM/BR/75/M2904]SYZ63180.1 Beta-lactamase_superfamily_domain_containing_protein [Leishmania braziliensis MHOM/BR/75/M2904]